MQQYNQDEETEGYPAGKGTGEMPTKPNKRGRDREESPIAVSQSFPPDGNSDAHPVILLCECAVMA